MISNIQTIKYPNYRKYQEKLLEAREELLQLHKGTHPSYVSELAQLEKIRDEQIKQAEIFRDYQVQSTHKIYQLEHEQAVAEYKVMLKLKIFLGRKGGIRRHDDSSSRRKEKKVN